MLFTHPTVFAVDEYYQIIIPVKKPCLVSICVGEQTFYDESNGIVRSLNTYHRVIIPMYLLDEAKQYTVQLRPVIKRKPYFTEISDIVEYEYRFDPIPPNGVRIFHVADTHNMVAEPVGAAKTFGDVDLLILNGDIIDHSGDPSKFLNIYEICAQITGGHKPVVFSRGNHDMRGEYAEKFAEYTPSHHGNTYYTFKLGHIWGMVLDCGEDKSDEHLEYGNTVACHPFRLRQSQFIDEVIRNKEREYASDKVTTKLVISHIPFTYIQPAPFDIEQEIYADWVKKLREEILPDLMICGHEHILKVVMPGDKMDAFGQPCPVLIGAERTDETFIASGVVINQESVRVVFADHTGWKEEREIDI